MDTKTVGVLYLMDMMNKSKKEGIWIPKELIFNQDLDWSNKVLLSEILALDKLESGCFASNTYFGNLLGITPGAVSKKVSKLTELGYITTKEIYPKGSNNYRIIKPTGKKYSGKSDSKGKGSSIENKGVVPEKLGGTSDGTRGVLPGQPGGTSCGNTIITAISIDKENIEENTGTNTFGPSTGPENHSLEYYQNQYQKLSSNIRRQEKELARYNKYTADMFEKLVPGDLEQIKSQLKPEILAVVEPLLNEYYQLKEEQGEAWKNIQILYSNHNFNGDGDILGQSTGPVPESDEQSSQPKAPADNSVPVKSNPTITITSPDGASSTTISQSELDAWLYTKPPVDVLRNWLENLFKDYPNWEHDLMNMEFYKFSTSTREYHENDRIWNQCLTDFKSLQRVHESSTFSYPN